MIRMLNLMYTLFDDILVKHDVYKVATIGDAYFVASGVPIRNGSKHAGAICLLALELLDAVSSLPIPHLPKESLQLRIGIHSGPCLAGVAGIKMPRYLLFGDTVDLASQMESSGKSMRIQVSPSTAKLLTQQGGFLLLPRDEILSFQSQQLQTYWLLKHSA